MRISVGIANSSRRDRDEVRRGRDARPVRTAWSARPARSRRFRAPQPRRAAGDGRSGPSASVTVAETSAPGRANASPVTRTTPSISGASRWVRPTASPRSGVDRRRRAPRSSSPTSASRAAWVIGSCSSLHSRSRSAARSVGICAVERRGRRAVLGREREEAGPVEARRAQEREQLVVVRLGLAREADDERRPERGLGLRRRGCASIRSRNRSPLPHRFMPRSSGADACCSERSKYGTTVGELEHRRDAAGRGPRSGRGRAGGRAARPCGGEPVEPAQQRRERARLADVASVPGEVLRDEHDLGHAARRRARAPRPRSTRSCATAACRGTTGSRRTRRRGRSPRPPSRTPTARVGAGRGSSSRSRTPARLAAPRARPRERLPSPANPTTASASGSASASSVAVALGHAAGDHEPGVGPLRRRPAPGQSSIDSCRAASTNAQVLTTIRSASPACVRGREPVGEERGDDLVGVDGVLRAAQGLDEEPGGHGRILPGTSP